MRRNGETAKPAFVLVHGAWGGAWVWRRVLAPLRDAGYEVHAVTLTGCGERAHLRHRGIRLQTHIDDVLGLIEAEELRDVVLVGHSYAGMVITGAAAALQSADPSPLRGLVYLDAGVPRPGDGWGSAHSAEVARARLAVAAQHDDALPPPDPSEGFGLTDADAAWLRRRHVPHPFGMYREPLDYDEALLRPLPRLFIDCTAPAYPTIAPTRSFVRESPGWQVAEIATGHFPMVSQPATLVHHLRAFAEGLGE